MLKLKELLTHTGKWPATLLLGSLLVGCGGGGSEDILCGGDCGSVNDDSSDSNVVTDSDGFTLAFTRFNPQAWNYVGEEVEVTVTVNDFEGNPAQDGTVVYFYAEGGTIQSTCQTAAGACSATWFGSNPRPLDGRAEIFAWTLGVETFVDADANDQFDGIGVEAFDDLDEVYSDNNENGIYDAGEFFVDNPGLTANTYDYADGLYNGPRCNADCSNESVYIGFSGTIVMSSDDAEIVDDGGLGNSGSTVNIGSGVNNYLVEIGDINGNALPEGSSIEIGTSWGTLLSSDEIDITGGERDARRFLVSIAGAGSPGAGVLVITVTAGLFDREEVFFWNLVES